MKIEIGESLCYSYLRHVKRCWLVQANWKVSEHWSTYTADTELEKMFQIMKQKFDEDGTVFKQTKNAEQFVKQGEIDVIGIEQEGSIHALDVAFHESGLNYGGGSNNRVLKKLLRTYLILHAYSPPKTKFHIYFVSPKVHHAVQKPLEDLFTRLQEEYGDANWHLITNNHFAQIASETLEKASTVADTSELFVRASKLLDIAGNTRIPGVGLATRPRGLGVTRKNYSSTPRLTPSEPDKRPSLQPIVRRLMQVLLEDSPTLLNATDLHHLMDSEYCKYDLGLQIGNHALLRKGEDGRMVGSHSRYWSYLYAGKFYVCSQWWKDHHLNNAKALLNYGRELAQRHPHYQDILKHHIEALENYVSN